MKRPLTLIGTLAFAGLIVTGLILAPSAPSHADDEKAQDQASLSKETQIILMRRVELLTHVQEKIHELNLLGVQGGESEKLAAADYRLANAKAELEQARGEPDRARVHRTQAVDATRKQLQAVEAAYQAQTTTFDRLLDAIDDLAEAELALVAASR